MNTTREKNNNRRRDMVNWCYEKSLETTITAPEKGDFVVVDVAVDPTIEGRRKRLIDFTKTKGPSIGKSGNFMTRSWRAIRTRSLRKADQKAQRRASSERVARKNSLHRTQLHHPSTQKELCEEQPTKRKSASMSNLPAAQDDNDEDDDERIEFMFRRQPRERTRRLSTQARIKELFQAISDKQSSDEADRTQLFSRRTRKLSGQHVRKKSKCSQRRRIVDSATR